MPDTGFQKPLGCPYNIKYAVKKVKPLAQMVEKQDNLQNNFQNVLLTLNLWQHFVPGSSKIDFKS